MSGVEYLSPEGFRVDGRRPQEIRKLNCRMGVFQQADGSAFLELGNTKVLASVYGPHSTSQRSQGIHDKAVVNCQFSMAAFSTPERRKGSKDRKLRDTSQSLKEIFESAILTGSYPMSEISVNLQVLQSDGDYFSTCVNAGTMALVDAGIPLKDLVCACSATYIDDTPIIDVNYLETTAGAAVLTVSTFAKSGSILSLKMDTRLHMHNLDKVLTSAMQGCEEIKEKMNKIIISNLENHILCV